MLGEVRIALAVAYASIMLVDSLMEMCGRYASIQERISAFPYFESNRVVQACLWAIMQMFVAYISISELFLGFTVAYVVMASASMRSIKRLLRATKAKPAMPAPPD